jgi:hypothetical protein
MELVLDGVGVIRACFFKELLEVVLRRSCQALAITCGLYGVFSTTAANPLIDVAIDIGCGLLAVLLVPLLAGLGALLGTLDGDTG